MFQFNLQQYVNSNTPCLYDYMFKIKIKTVELLLCAYMSHISENNKSEKKNEEKQSEKRTWKKKCPVFLHNLLNNIYTCNDRIFKAVIYA